MPQLIDEAEQVAVVHFTIVRLVALRHAGDLDMSHVLQVLPEFHRDVAFDDLYVVEVHLHLEIGLAHRPADSVRLGLGVEEIPRNVSS